MHSTALSSGALGIALEGGEIFFNAAGREAIQQHLSSPPIALNQAVVASRFYPVTGGEPVPARPLIQTGAPQNGARRGEILEQNLIGIEQFSLRAFHGDLLSAMIRVDLARRIALADFFRNPSRSSPINHNKTNIDSQTISF
jgi:hypothetical protein